MQRLSINSKYRSLAGAEFLIGKERGIRLEEFWDRGDEMRCLNAKKAVERESLWGDRKSTGLQVRFSVGY